ncbi:hypothetical protein P12x_002278 [Tundrisphaera lichenicola]|uniref:hypothetical protein n=1 Tax=Tundrisphaera lichenicola TaxID=2029860 RepID=UPI003EBB69D3
MRKLWNLLSDPGLHFLLIALFLALLAFGTTVTSESLSRAAPVRCMRCHAYHEAGKECSCWARERYARAHADHDS